MGNSPATRRIIAAAFLVLAFRARVLPARTSKIDPSLNTWIESQARQALARLHGTGKRPAPRRDLARYLRGDVPRPVPGQANPRARPAPGDRIGSEGADAAVEPFRTMLAANGLDGRLAPNLAEALLRAGFGVPQRFRKLLQLGEDPVRAAARELARALRAAKGGASIRKTHVELERITGPTPGPDYVR